MLPGKRERLRIFLDRLSAAPAAGSADEAFTLMTRILNEVEDELTTISFDPAAWEHDGRLYAPLPDSARDVSDRLDLTRYRSRSHNTWISTNGAICIATLRGERLLDKAGKDGRKVDAR